MYTCSLVLINYMEFIYTVIGEYYLGYFRRSSGGQLSVILMNTISTPVYFTIEAPVARFYYAGVVDGNDQTIVDLPFSVAVFQNQKEYKGVYIRANSDAVNVIGQDEHSSWSETFFAIPYETSGAMAEYVYYGISVPGYSSSYQSVILIVGTEDRTTMKLTVTQTATTNFGSTLYTGREYSFVINRLQTFYIRSTGDLTGTKIITNKQVSVISGNELAQVPSNLCCGNPLIEQVPPLTSWGRVFYTMPLATRKSYTIKILASQDLTEIELHCNNFKESHTINETRYYTKILSKQESCVINSNKQVLVAQFSHGRNDDGIGDPMMMIVPDVLQFTNRFTIATLRDPTSYRHYVNIIVLAQYYQPEMIYLMSGGKNISLNTQKWIPIRVEHSIKAYSAQVTISEGVAHIIHADKAALMKVSSYGFASYESYGNPGQVGYLTGLLYIIRNSNALHLMRM